MTLLNTYAIYLAWLVALVATGGSLFFSEVMHFVPCQLCWFQRVLMYPLILLLGIASFRHDRGIFIYVMPMSVLGAGLSLFHYLEQKIPGFGFPELCQVGVPCNVTWINWWGFVTIPFLCLTAFLIITLLMFLSRQADRISEIAESE